MSIQIAKANHNKGGATINIYDVGLVLQGSSKVYANNVIAKPPPSS